MARTRPRNRHRIRMATTTENSPLLGEHTMNEWMPSSSDLLLGKPNMEINQMPKDQNPQNLPNLQPLPTPNQNQNGNQKSDTGGSKRSAASTKSGKQPEPLQSPKYQKLEYGLNETFGSVAMLLIGIPPLQPDGLVVLGKTPSLSEKLTRLAYQHAPVYDFLEKLIAESVIFTVAMEFAIIGVNIAYNHNWLPAQVKANVEQSGVVVDKERVANDLIRAQELHVQAMIQQQQAQVAGV